MKHITHDQFEQIMAEHRRITKTQLAFIAGSLRLIAQALRYTLAVVQALIVALDELDYLRRCARSKQPPVDWEGFLEYMEGKDGQTAKCLRACMAERFELGRMWLVATDSMTATWLVMAKDQLKKALREFYQCRFDVKIREP